MSQFSFTGNYKLIDPLVNKSYKINHSLLGFLLGKIFTKMSSSRFLWRYLRWWYLTFCLLLNHTNNIQCHTRMTIFVPYIIQVVLCTKSLSLNVSHKLEETFTSSISTFSISSLHKICRQNDIQIKYVECY